MYAVSSVEYIILEISEFKNLYDVHCEVFLDIIIILWR